MERQAKYVIFRTRTSTKRPYIVQNGQDRMAKKQGSAKRNHFASEASLGLRTKIRINSGEGMYGAPRRCHEPLEYEVNIRGIGGMRGAGITRWYREMCMLYMRWNFFADASHSSHTQNDQCLAL